MNAKPKKQRTPAEVWRAIDDEGARDEMERIARLDDDALDRELRAAGVDPVAVGEAGADLAEKLLARRAREAAPAATLARGRARLTARRGARAPRSRPDLLAAIEAAQKDPRLPKQASVHFRNHHEAEATDEELANLLDALEELIEAHEKKKRTKGS